MAPETDETRIGVEIDIHCVPWDGISHVVTSGCSFFGIRYRVTGTENS